MMTCDLMLEIYQSQENCAQRREIAALQREGKGCTKTAKALIVTRDSVHKFSVTGTMAARPGRGRKTTLPTAAARFLRRQLVKELQWNLEAAGSEVSVDTVMRVSTSKTCTCTNPKVQEISGQICSKTCRYATKILGFFPVEQQKQIWNILGLWIWSEEGRRKKVATTVMLWGRFASSGTGNRWRKHHAVCEETEAWVSLDLPTAPGSQTHLKSTKEF